MRTARLLGVLLAAGLVACSGPEPPTAPEPGATAATFDLTAPVGQCPSGFEPTADDPAGKDRNGDGWVCFRVNAAGNLQHTDNNVNETAGTGIALTVERLEQMPLRVHEAYLKAACTENRVDVCLFNAMTPATCQGAVFYTYLLNDGRGDPDAFYYACVSVFVYRYVPLWSEVDPGPWPWEQGALSEVACEGADCWLADSGSGLYYGIRDGQNVSGAGTPNRCEGRLHVCFIRGTFDDALRSVDTEPECNYRCNFSNSHSQTACSFDDCRSRCVVARVPDQTAYDDCT